MASMRSAAEDNRLIIQSFPFVVLIKYMNSFTLRAISMTALCLLGAVMIRAQGKVPAPKSAEDREWDKIQATFSPSVTEEASGQSGKSTSRTLQDAARDFKKTADEAKAFRQKYPKHLKAAEAKKLEATSVLNSVLAGDNSEESRAMALVADVRRDTSLPASARIQVVELAEVVRLLPVMGDSEKLMAGRLESARRLIEEFPQESGGYEALLRVAENQPNRAKSTALAQELITLPAVAPLKAAAQAILDRYGLIGRSLTPIATTVLGEVNAIGAAHGRPVLLYTWAMWSPGSVIDAKNLVQTVPAGVALIGINLDQDVARARLHAQQESLPGEQIYDERGFESPLARALKVTASLPAYVTNANGEILEIASESGDVAAKLIPVLR
jgi:hypothetical protein